MTYEATLKRLDDKEKEVNEIMQLDDGFKRLERWVLLNKVDNAWVEHIDTMTMLKREILTRTDPVSAYKQEGYDMFENMISNIRTNTAKMILNAHIEKVVQRPMQEQKKNIKANATPVEKGSQTVRRTTKQIGRNDPCPCGSGKKYKNCCGKN